jgi:hypothetical protein
MALKEGHRQLAVQLDEELYKRLQQAALDRNTKMTDIVRGLIERDLAPRPQWPAIAEWPRT